MDPLLSPGMKRQFSDNGENGREKRMAVPASSTETVFRILCPASRIGSVIGKGGSIIKTLREETQSRIKVADAVPGVDERVIIISGVESAEQEWTAVQEGLLRVHARITDVPPEDNDAPLGGPSTTRLLVASSQIGCLLGKGGSIISQMRKETGAQIRVLPKEQLPGCALSTDELVQIIGELPSVVKALEAISGQLRANPPREKPASLMHMQQPLLSSGGGAQLALGHQSFHTAGPLWQQQQQLGGGLPSYMQQLGMHSLPGRGGPLGVAGSAGLLLGAGGGPQMEVVFRILCPSLKIGSVIGKGGSIIKQMRDETTARIKIADAVAEVDERVVIISGNEALGAPFSPAQEAIFRIHNRLIEPEAQDPSAVITTRMLVPSSQIGCLLGKGGAIVSEMRRSSRANIRILPKDQLPGCALETDELLQLIGDGNAVRSALHQVTSRLRASPPKDALPSGPVQDGAAGVAAGTYPQQSPARGFAEGGAAAGGFGGLRPSTLTVPVPISAIGSIIGRGGTNIAQIRNISGARVKLHELEEGSGERIVEMTGSPEQLQAAQSLLQAFIINGTANAQGSAF